MSYCGSTFSLFLMLRLRTTKNSSGSTAVQVVRYDDRRTVIVRHIGSARTLEDISHLKEEAIRWIETETEQSSLFPEGISSKRFLDLDTCRYLGFRYSLAHDVLMDIADQLQLTKMNDRLLLDLVIMRIIEPASKVRSLELLKTYFGIHYARSRLYRDLRKIVGYKSTFERLAVSFAHEELCSDLSFVLYDVTTLYFESFSADELRKPGFSKDNKAQQPQIVIGLLVDLAGFPLAYEIFEGNTFEGHTMIPVLEQFARLHGVTTSIVVGDAAMLSRSNIQELERRGFFYIVGARLANASSGLIAQTSRELQQRDEATIRIPTIMGHGDLVCSFSAKRFRKDSLEMERQIAKAKKLITIGQPGKRAKFVKRADGKDSYILDETLMAKAKLLLGVKGYYTNVPRERLDDEGIIARYHDLWHVEQSFRMTKSDLVARPIFHRKKDAIKAHMLICFMALAMGKTMELKTGLSLRRIVHILKSVTDARIVDEVTKREFTLRSELSKEVRFLLEKLHLSY